MSDITSDFRRELLKLGIIRLDEQETLWQIAKRCARTTGVPMGAGVGIATAGAGSVAVPGIGAVPGYLAGFLGGLATGTVMCTAANLKYREPLRELLE